VDDDDGGKRPVARWRVEDCLNCIVAALVGDGLAVGGEANGCEQSE
jgi:hypothetical protein